MVHPVLKWSTLQLTVLIATFLRRFSEIAMGASYGVLLCNVCCYSEQASLRLRPQDYVVVWRYRKLRTQGDRLALRHDVLWSTDVLPGPTGDHNSLHRGLLGFPLARLLQGQGSDCLHSTPQGPEGPLLKQARQGARLVLSCLLNGHPVMGGTIVHRI